MAANPVTLGELFAEGDQARALGADPAEASLMLRIKWTGLNAQSGETLRSRAVRHIRHNGGTIDEEWFAAQVDELHREELYASLHERNSLERDLATQARRARDRGIATSSRTTPELVERAPRQASRVVRRSGSREGPSDPSDDEPGSDLARHRRAEGRWGQYRTLRANADALRRPRLTAALAALERREPL